MNSTTSMRRSPDSILETKDCERLSFRASSVWFRPASVRAFTRTAHRVRCVRVRRDFKKALHRAEAHTYNPKLELFGFGLDILERDV